MNNKISGRARLVFLSICLPLISSLWIIILGGHTSATFGAGDFLYVDGVSGIDTGECDNPNSPCMSIRYAISQTVAGDTIKVAQGPYLENLLIERQVILEGGYQAGSWIRDIEQYETTIDGSNGRFTVGDWDGRYVARPSVIKDGATYKMWFDGSNVLGITDIGYATSADGISWVKHSSNPVLNDVGPDWNPLASHSPLVLKENGVYRMWFEYVGGNGAAKLAYAASDNGIYWLVDPGYPVLPSGPDQFDQNAAGQGTIIFDDGIYKLWYHAIGEEGGIIAHATSPDGYNWTKHGPVLTPAESGWESNWLWGPSVLKIDDVYWMWYGGAESDIASIGVVTSTNGIIWNRFLPEPVITDTEANLGNPSVISDGSKLKIWYNAWYNDPLAGTWRGRIDYAESEDGIHWTKPVTDPVLIAGELGKEGWSTIYFDTNSSGSVLDGFTIRGGHSSYGGGISVHTTDITISNNVIRENRAQNGDGGIQAWGGSSVVINNNIIRDNYTPGGAGGGITIAGSEGKIFGNHIENNSSYHGGGGIFFVDASGSIRDNKLINNQTVTGGGGILVIDSDYVVSVTQNTIHGNVAGWGGGIQVERAGIIVESNDILGNQAENWAYGAGGIAVFDAANRQVDIVNNLVVGNDNEGLEISNFAEANIINNTFVDNGRVGIEVFAWPTVPPDPFTAHVYNNIVVGHNECGVTGFNGVTIVARNNDVWSNLSEWCVDYINLNNISEDPLFMNPGGRDYHLKFESPTIDSGTGINAPADDLDGNPRPQGAGIDMGAYELTIQRTFLPLVSSPSTGPPPGYVGQIAFVSNRDGNSEIYLTDALGTDLVNITQHPAADGSPDWSPDGSKIAFSSNRAGTGDIYVMNFDGSGVRQLTAPYTVSGSPRWSPDGSKIAFSSQQVNLQGLEIYWMYADGSGLRSVYSGPGYGGRISWSPDGNRLLFDSLLFDSPHNNYELFVVNLDGSGLQRVASTSSWEFMPAWSPDGKYIAFTSDRWLDYVDVYVANANGSGVKNLSLHQSYSYGPAWSPDSQWIVFMSVEGLYVTRPAWTNPTKLTDLSMLESHAEWTWSPDSERIVFAANSGGSDEIFVIGIDGQGLRNLSNHSAWDSDPVWRPSQNGG